MKLITLKIGITNCYILGEDNQVLIDTGEIGKAEGFKKGFAHYSVNPTDIKLIILTHTHWDHTGCLSELVELTGAKVLVHASEAERLRNGEVVMPSGITTWGRFIVKNVLGKMVPPQLQSYDADIVMDGPEYPLSDYGVNATVIHTPGHSPGSISIVYEDNLIFVGDMAMSGMPLRLSPGMPILAEVPEKITTSWDSILSRNIKTIFPSHGQCISVDKLKRDLPKT